MIVNASCGFIQEKVLRIARKRAGNLEQSQPSKRQFTRQSPGIVGELEFSDERLGFAPQLTFGRFRMRKWQKGFYNALAKTRVEAQQNSVHHGTRQVKARRLEGSTYPQS